MQPAFRIGENQGGLEVTSRTEYAFRKVLGETGSQALFYHLEHNHGLSAADLTSRRADFLSALASIFGDYGSQLLIRRVSKSAD